MANGEFEAYSYTFEKIQYESELASKASENGVKAADEVDIFADETEQPKVESMPSTKVEVKGGRNDLFML